MPLFFTKSFIRFPTYLECGCSYVMMKAWLRRNGGPSSSLAGIKEQREVRSVFLPIVFCHCGDDVLFSLRGVLMSSCRGNFVLKRRNDDNIV